MTRVFVIHALKDQPAFDRLVAHAKSGNVSVEFDHTQAKHPWVPAWKAECRKKIYNCEGCIVLISKSSGDGSLAWELESATGLDTPILGVHVDKFDRGPVPKEIAGSTVIEFDWPAIAKFIQSLSGSTASAGRR